MGWVGLGCDGGGVVLKIKGKEIFAICDRR